MMAATKFSFFNKRSKIGTNDCLLPYNIEYMLIKYPLSIQDGLQKSKMAATIFSFFDISTADRGDFPRVIEITLFFFFVVDLKTNYPEKKQRD